MKWNARCGNCHSSRQHVGDTLVPNVAGNRQRLNRSLVGLTFLTTVVAVAVLVGAVAPVRDLGATGPSDNPSAEPQYAPSQSSSEVAQPTPEGDPIRVEVGDDLQDFADRYPRGTTFRLAAGLHRNVSVIPRDGQTFEGENGAIVSGARELSPSDFVSEDGAWWVGGQSQEGATFGVTLAGAERDKHPEELFVDGTRRLRHVASLGELDESSWFFEYEKDRIWLGADPAGFDSIETSVLPFAFGGTAVRNVTLKNLIVEKYASPYQYGAIGGDSSNRYTYDWRVIDVVARYNHGAGIIMGPGMVVESSRIHHNGQLGLAGNGEHRSENDRLLYTAPTVVRYSEIDHNLTLGFDWSHEGGGTKFTFMESGMVFVGNWVHDNNGPGIWWDIRNKDVLVSENVVENNEQMGIFYEISYGNSLIERNVIRGNGLDHNRGGIEISLSEGVTVHDNVVVNNGAGVVVSHDEERRQRDSEPGKPLLTASVNIVGNLIKPNSQHGVLLFGEADEIYDEITFEANTYCGVGNGDPFRWQGRRLTAEVWQTVHPTERLLEACPEDPVQNRGLEGVAGAVADIGPGRR